MTYEDVKKIALAKKKGTFVKIKYRKTLPSLKAYKGIYEITKVSEVIVRFGVEYENIGAVREARLQGALPMENHGLPWGEWVIPGYFIRHKGAYYLRCTLVNGNHAESRYFVNGEPADPAHARILCQASAFKSNDKQTVFTINVDNIISIS